MALSKWTKFSRKSIAVFLCVLLVSCAISAYIAYDIGLTKAQNSSLPTNTLSGGVSPGAPQYTIFGVSGTYYVKDQYNAIQTSWASTNAAISLNFALALGTTFITDGTYHFSTTINAIHSLIANGGNYTSLMDDSTTADGINVYNNAQLIGFQISASSSSYSGNLINIGGSQNVGYANIQNLIISGTGTSSGTGILFTAQTTGNYVSGVNVQNTAIYNLKYGITFNAVSGGWTNANMFSNDFGYSTPYGIFFTGIGSTSQNVFYSYQYQGASTTICAVTVSGGSNQWYGVNIYDLPGGAYSFNLLSTSDQTTIIGTNVLNNILNNGTNGNYIVDGYYNYGSENGPATTGVFLSAQPNCAGWGASQAGMTWFDNATGVQETWDGTQIIRLGYYYSFPNPVEEVSDGGRTSTKGWTTINIYDAPVGATEATFNIYAQVTGAGGGNPNHIQMRTTGNSQTDPQETASLYVPSATGYYQTQVTVQLSSTRQVDYTIDMSNGGTVTTHIWLLGYR